MYTSSEAASRLKVPNSSWVWFSIKYSENGVGKVSIPTVREFLFCLCWTNESPCVWLYLQFIYIKYDLVCIIIRVLFCVNILWCFSLQKVDNISIQKCKLFLLLSLKNYSIILFIPIPSFSIYSILLSIFCSVGYMLCNPCYVFIILLFYYYII